MRLKGKIFFHSPGSIEHGCIEIVKSKRTPAMRAGISSYSLEQFSNYKQI